MRATKYEKDIREWIYRHYPGVSQRDVRFITTVVFEAMHEIISQGHTLRIEGLGRFYSYAVQAKNCYDYTTKKKTGTSQRAYLRFLASYTLKQKLRKTLIAQGKLEAKGSLAQRSLDNG